ncbi:DUF2147 domain-containing protein [Acinetobacter sp.]|uniref:DUF2147 domain-containing protein n=1 Tax=Acinetobacter sp. TaxID=472 RepID=UPI00258EB0E9|nr:DUF2147 domain-containing protein [Acinetobacter sp.]
MQKKIIFASFAGLLSFSASVLAQDLTGIWQQIDDKTGNPKALIDISKESNGTYTGKIIKITPRPGYTPKSTCIDCPPPYTNKPILGLDVFKNLKQEEENIYTGGRILDPLTGKFYNLKAKQTANGKRLLLRGYIGISAIGRTQTWLRQE